MTTTLPKVIASLSRSLSVAAIAGATSATLDAATDSEGVALPAGKYAFTIDRLTAQKEFIICDLSGTALSNIQHITVQGVVSTGFTKYHRFGATVELTDWAVIQRIIANLTGSVGFDSGAHLGYDAAPTGLVSNEFATVAYVLSVVSGGTVSLDSQVLTNQTLGETIALNDLVYFKEADGRWWKVSAATSSTYTATRLAFAKTAGAAGASATIGISGPVTGFTGLTNGSKYYASDTGGAISTTPGTATVFVGWGLGTTQIFLQPQLIYWPTANEKAAMVGSSGTPSASNLFVTAADLNTNVLYKTFDAATDQTQGTTDSSSFVGEANATTKRYLLAQKFVPTKQSIRGVRLWKVADTGSFTGTVKIALQIDSAGSPSGADLASFTISNAAWLKLASAAEFGVAFSTQYSSLVPAGTYWIVITPSTNDTANHPNLGINTAGGYASGALKYNNTTDGWVLVATSMLYFKTLEGNKGKIVQTDATEGVVLTSARAYTYVASDVTTAGSGTTITGNTNDNTVYSAQYEGGFFTLNGGLKIQVFHSFTGVVNLNHGATIKFKYNGSTLANYQTSINSGAGGAGSGAYNMTTLILNQNSLSAQNFTVMGSTITKDGVSTTSIASIAMTPFSSSGTGTVDTSQPGKFEITITNTANADSTVYWGSIIERVTV